MKVLSEAKISECQILALPVLLFYYRNKVYFDLSVGKWTSRSYDLSILKKLIFFFTSNDLFFYQLYFLSKYFFEHGV